MADINAPLEQYFTEHTCGEVHLVMVYIVYALTVYTYDIQ